MFQSLLFPLRHSFAFCELLSKVFSLHKGISEFTLLNSLTYWTIDQRIADKNEVSLMALVKDSDQNSLSMDSKSAECSFMKLSQDLSQAYLFVYLFLLQIVPMTWFTSPDSYFHLLIFVNDDHHCWTLSNLTKLFLIIYLLDLRHQSFFSLSLDWEIYLFILSLTPLFFLKATYFVPKTD